MINVRKFIHPSLKNSHNVFSDILTPLNKRVGFINGSSPIVPIYFYRYIGVKKNEKEYYDKLNNLDKKLSNLNGLYFKFISNIPFEVNSILSDKLQSIWNENQLEPFDNVKIEALITSLKKSGSLIDANSSLLTSSIEESLSYVLNLYLQKEPYVNLTKIKNFTLKLITWINNFAMDLVNNFNLDSKSTHDIINPKVLYLGSIKKHEVYFLIFLSRLGFDVLYINSPDDGDFSTIDKEGQFSKIFILPYKRNLDIEALSKNHTSHTSFNSPSLNSSVTSESFNKDKYINSITCIYKISNDIFTDVTSSLNERGNFVGKPMPLVPIYFYRYIGITEKESEYYNALYRIDKTLESLGSLYFKITNPLPVENNMELTNKTAHIWNAIPQHISESEKSDKKVLSNVIGMLINAGAFPDLKEEIANSSIIKSFYSILELYISKELNINTAKIKNFAIKIIMWINKYVPDLFKNFDYLKNSSKEIYNPKVMYYGNIRKHEAYFLIFLSLIGCDILYINSKEDTVFNDIDNEQKYSKLFELPNRCELKDFPKEELIVRHETTAFRASQEIENIIYNEQDGLFQPWQFENYKTRPLTLKTTFDELKILWNEEARMRPGFKVENGTVYIPNLFAKISGTHRDLSIYWNEIKELKSANNLLFIPKIPYVKEAYSKYDLYSLEYCFKDGVVDKESLLKHRLYKFHYLKTPLQDGIIDKINQLITMPILKNSNLIEFKLKILLCILNLDKIILEMIQKFDYPFKIPKIMIYAKDEAIFTEEDSIILAFLNLMGFDIVIFTPTGYNNIETRVYEEYYDIHKLEDVTFNLDIPNLNSIRKSKSNSFWSNLFK